MFDLMKSASDDQTALGICFLTLAGAAFFVFASFHLGPAGQKLRANERKKLELKVVSDASDESEQPQERAA